MLKLEWCGKEECLLEHTTPTDKQFIINKDKSVNFDTTNNIIIEGDNLDVLKLLQSEYQKKIKMIYIDPPYNTGRKGLFRDKYWQARECKHSNWLSMMYPRLKLARELLRDDGVIFVSIDDHEQANLKLLMDEVFGEGNFVANIIWEKKMGRQNDATHISTNHEYIIFFAKTKSSFNINLLPRTYETDKAYKNPDNDPRGKWSSITLQAKSGNDKNFEFTFPNKVKWKPPNGTHSRYSKETLLSLYKDNRIYFGKNQNNIPRVKKFLSEVKQGLIPVSILYSGDVSNTQKAKQEVKKLFFDLEYDTTPKPEALLEKLINISTQENDLVLDFFAGTGTTGAVALKMNRKFIMIQIDEKIIQKGYQYKNISDLTVARIVKTIQSIKEYNTENNIKDLGFKVFELTESNFKNEENPDIQLDVGFKVHNIINML